MFFIPYQCSNSQRWNVGLGAAVAEKKFKTGFFNTLVVCHGDATGMKYVYENRSKKYWGQLESWVKVVNL